MIYKGDPALSETCDCDLDLPVHRSNRDHYRACKASYEGDGGLTLTCRVIRGHEGAHWTVFTREARWEEGGAAIFEEGLSNAR